MIVRNRTQRIKYTNQCCDYAYQSIASTPATRSIARNYERQAVKLLDLIIAAEYGSWDAHDTLRSLPYCILAPKGDDIPKLEERSDMLMNKRNTSECEQQNDGGKGVIKRRARVDIFGDKDSSSDSEGEIHDDDSVDEAPGSQIDVDTDFFFDPETKKRRKIRQLGNDMDITGVSDIVSQLSLASERCLSAQVEIQCFMGTPEH